MKYELLKNPNRGIPIDNTPVLQDLRDAYEVSFLMPDSGSYIALFMDEKGLEYRRTIRDGICKLPKDLFGKEQTVSLTVVKIDKERILEAFPCSPLKLTAWAYMRKYLWQVSVDMTEKEIIDRQNELERKYSKVLGEIEELKEKIMTVNTSTTNVNKILERLIAQEEIV